jgi:hypothetical protein
MRQKLHWEVGNGEVTKKQSSQAWWPMPVVPALRRWRQWNLKYKAILGYIESSRPPGLCSERPISLPQPPPHKKSNTKQEESPENLRIRAIKRGRCAKEG